MFNSAAAASFQPSVDAVSAAAPPDRKDVAPMEARSSSGRFLAYARHDVSRLAHVLHTLRCSATLRTTGGTVVALTQTPRRTGAAQSARTRYSAPVYDGRGAPIASLELSSCELGTPGVMQHILESLVDAAANSIAERWFRRCYRRHWILSAQCVDHPEKVILMALDREQRVIAADWHARRLLAPCGVRFDGSVSLPTIFRVSDSSIPRTQYCDATINLMGIADGAEWNALVTAPDVQSDAPYDERALVLAFPRVDTHGCVEGAVKRAKTGCALPPRTLSDIREYIEKHLEEKLGLNELASVVGISVSHFSRCFRLSVGLTPHDYVIRRRVLRAQALLAETDLELVDIALRTGFTDQSHFSRRFHKLTGTPPNRFRRQHR